jgi:hypothetical protein
VLNLSCAMAYKNTLAGLDHSGGKAVSSSSSSGGVGDSSVLTALRVFQGKQAAGRLVRDLRPGPCPCIAAKAYGLRSVLLRGTA